MLSLGLLWHEQRIGKFPQYIRSDIVHAPGGRTLPSGTLQYFITLALVNIALPALDEHANTY